MAKTVIDGYTEWQSDPETVGINKLPQHATFMPYGSFDEAKKAERYASSRCALLNGEWKFSLYENHTHRPADFAKPDYNSSDWDIITVPCSWQMQGYDQSLYCNVRYPWENEEDICPPNAPTNYNPVGCYLKEINISREALSKRTVICFEGVESAFYLYVNGNKIGYSESTFHRSEFDITEYLTEGSNVIGVEVYRWCTGSWLECQDMWRLGGIFRDVYIYTTEKEYISDFTVVAEPDMALNIGRCDVLVKISGAYENLSVDMCILDANGETVATDTKRMRAGNNATLNATVDNIKPWSSESPYLYTAALTLKNNGAPIEYISQKIGFRKVEIKDGIIRINGKRIVFKGTNRHEFDCRTGRYMSEEIMRYDIELMKRSNINAVRTSHYPNCLRFLELCDEYGIYIIDENNMETHGTGRYNNDKYPRLPASRPEWIKACMERIRATYNRDKNATCVIAWSLGNESSGGAIAKMMHDYLKKSDPTRFVHYECNNSLDGDEKELSDVMSKMYFKPWQCEEYAKNNEDGRPFILCEFEHAMGNSCGSTDKYTALWDKYPCLQGGFIWDWVDQSILTTDECGTEYLAYGGDFGENPHDGHFCGNGLLFGDRKPSPKLAEIRRLYQNVDFHAVDPQRGIIEIKNKFLFTNLNEFELYWKQSSNKGILNEGTANIDIAPDETGVIDLKLSKAVDTEYYLDLEFRVKEKTRWCEKGHVIAYEQFIINEFENLYRAPVAGTPLTVNDTYGSLRISAENIDIRFERRERNQLCSIKVDGKELLQAPMRLNFWRALTDNDRGNRAGVRLACWRDAGDTPGIFNNTKWSINGYEILDGGRKVVVTSSATVCTQPKSKARVIYTVTSKGMEIDMRFCPDASLPEVPEISVLFELTKDFEEVTYLGRGPEENYIDRCNGARIGLYNTTVNDMWTDYLKPQECGNRTGVRYAVIKGKNKAFSVTAKKQIELNVCHYLPKEVEAARHKKDLPEYSKTVLRLIARQQGVGGYDSWGSTCNKKYLNTTDKTYNLKFRIDF